jgi:hypothetical protein
MQTIEEIQAEIDEIQEEVNSLIVERNKLDWDNVPTIVEINGSRWILGPEASEDMNWQDAIEWCKSVGGELPPRNILLECYMNEEIRPEFTATTYWSSTELSATNAWSQYFVNGFQTNFSKTYAYYVRAVRRLDI